MSGFVTCGLDCVQVLSDCPAAVVHVADSVPPTSAVVFMADDGTHTQHLWFPDRHDELSLLGLQTKVRHFHWARIKNSMVMTMRGTYQRRRTKVNRRLLNCTVTAHPTCHPLHPPVRPSMESKTISDNSHTSSTALRVCVCVWGGGGGGPRAPGGGGRGTEKPDSSFDNSPPSCTLLIPSLSSSTTILLQSH
jgi:hypothetical protein